MALDQGTELSRDDTDALVARHETGVLSLAEGDQPYAIPISYGYAPEERWFYLRLVSDADSQKEQFLASSPRAHIVIYEEDDPIYRSVVATGPLENIPRDDLTSEHIEQYGEAKRPLFEIWGKNWAELDVTLYRLAPTDLTGRRIEVDRDI
jgi:nitroimidazol reductase NimA-like FMN-containing flavoprotein (pyridoxamine 5'-phosphate oxidase superfamily)